MSGPARGKDLVVDHEMVVGRGVQGVVDLGGDSEVSQRHARFFFSPEGALLVEDAGSTNGTFVNDRRIGSQRLIRPGDRIRVGTTVLEVRPDEPAVAPRRPIAEPTTRAAEPVAARRSLGPAAAVLGVILLLGVAAAAFFVGRGSKSTKALTQTVAAASTGAAARQPANGAVAGVDGTVYVESNIAQRDGNSILAFQYRSGGDLHPMRIAEYPTGGAGSADLTDSGVLDADQHLNLDTARKLLFAVNQGSDTIAVFHVLSDGSLSPAPGSPFPSGGWAPASVGVSGDAVIVTNKAQDGVRDLKGLPPTYATFHIEPDGSLVHFGPVIKAPPGYSPTDAKVAPNGTFVMSTEEGGPLRAFVLGSNGLRQGANSPLQPNASIFPAGFPAAKKWGLGIAANPTRDLVYIGMATVNKIAVYRYDATGRLTFVRAVDAPGAVLPCWVIINRAGTRLYTANAGNNTVSVFDVSNPTDPVPLQTLRLHGDGNPWDIGFDPAGTMIFLIDPRARMNVPPGYGQGLHTLLINSDGTLTEPYYSPAAVPVGLDVNPFGLAVDGQP